MGYVAISRNLIELASTVPAQHPVINLVRGHLRLGRGHGHPSPSSTGLLPKVDGLACGHHHLAELVGLGLPLGDGFTRFGLL